MTNAAIQPSGSTEADSQVSQAWIAHYRGQHDEAIRQFEQVLQRWPDHIDANYGMALSLKIAGRNAQAAEAFGKTKGLVDAAHAALHEDAEHPRYQMLSRLCEQNLAMSS